MQDNQRLPSIRKVHREAAALDSLEPKDVGHHHEALNGRLRPSGGLLRPPRRARLRGCAPGRLCGLVCFTLCALPVPQLLHVSDKRPLRAFPVRPMQGRLLERTYV